MRKPVHRCRVLSYVIAGALVAAVVVAAFAIQERRKRGTDDAPYVNDAIQFWCAGHLIRDGRSPYEVRGQAEISRAAGWNARRHGAGRYDFMPFYYPYWVGLAAVPLTCVSFSQFLALWSLLQYAAVIAAAWMLCRLPHARSQGFSKIPGIWSRRSLPALLLIAFFPLATQVAEMGQVGNFALLAVVVLWWCAERNRDAVAGAVLALLCSKPQLGVLLVPCVLLWALRHKRYRVLWGFGGGVAALLGVSFLVRPLWFGEFLRAPFETPMLTGDEPWKVTTWTAVLKTAGFDGVAFAILYAALAVPVLVWAFCTAWNRERSVADVASISLLAVWFISPYARSYDMVVLLFPLMVLLGRITAVPRGIVLLCAALLPHYHQFVRWQRAAYPVMGLEIWWCWLPAALTLLWLATERGWIAAWDAEAAQGIRPLAPGRPGERPA